MRVFQLLCVIIEVIFWSVEGEVKNGVEVKGIIASQPESGYGAFVDLQNCRDTACNHNEFARRKRMIAEAIVALVEDQIEVENRMNNNSMTRLVPATSYKLGTQIERLTGRTMMEPFTHKLVLQKKILATNWGRKEIKQYKVRGDAFEQLVYFQNEKERPAEKNAQILMENQNDVNPLGMLADLHDKKDASSVRQMYRPVRARTCFVNKDQQCFGMGRKLGEKEQTTKITKEEELLDPVTYARSASHQRFSPFRGLFLFPFNTGFADFGNQPSPTKPPKPNQLENQPVHILECSDMSRSFCVNSLCTVKCLDGNKVEISCSSNSVEVKVDATNGRFINTVTCGRN